LKKNEKIMVFLSYLRKIVILCRNNLLFIYCIGCQKSCFFGRKVFGWWLLVREIEIAALSSKAMTEGWIPTFVGMTEMGAGMTYGGIGITPGKQGFTGQVEKGIGITCKIKGRYRKSIK